LDILSPEQDIDHVSASEIDQQDSAQEPSVEEETQYNISEPYAEYESNKEDELPESERAEVVKRDTDSDPSDMLLFGAPPKVVVDEPPMMEDFRATSSMSRESRRAMLISFSIIGVALIGVGAYLFHEHVIMPRPAKLSGTIKGPSFPQFSVEEEVERHSDEVVTGAETDPSDQLQALAPIQDNQPFVSNQQPPVVSSHDGVKGPVMDPSTVATPNQPTEQGDNTLAATAVDEALPAIPVQPVSETPPSPEVALLDKQPVIAAIQPPMIPKAEKATSVVQHKPTAELAENSSEPETDNLVAKATVEGIDLEKCCKSIEEFERVLKLKPNDAEIVGKLAYFYLNKGKNLEAEKFARRTLEIDPKDSRGWIVLGASRHAQRDLKGAKEAYRQCAEQAVGKYLRECKYLAR